MNLPINGPENIEEYYKKTKNEPTVKSRIKLTKELLSKELFTDVMFIVLTSSAAMGNAGLVIFIKRDGTEYFFNFVEDELNCSDIEEFFPPIAQFKRDSASFEDWHLVYLGVETSIAIKDEVFSAFKQYAKEYPVKNYKLFQNWRRVVLLTLKGE